MKFYWELNESDWLNYMVQKQFENESYDNGYYLGRVRVGNLNFDIMNWCDNLCFDLYVGGVDSGYGYSEGVSDKRYKDYPYDFCDDFCVTDYGVNTLNIDKYKKIMEERIKEELERIVTYYPISNKEYIPINKIEEHKINLLDKANEELKMW